MPKTPRALSGRRATGIITSFRRTTHKVRGGLYWASAGCMQLVRDDETLQHGALTRPRLIVRIKSARAWAAPFSRQDRISAAIAGQITANAATGNPGINSLPLALPMIQNGMVRANVSPKKASMSRNLSASLRSLSHSVTICLDTNSPMIPLECRLPAMFTRNRPCAHANLVAFPSWQR